MKLRAALLTIVCSAMAGFSFAAPYGAIGEKWKELRAEAGPLGPAKTDEANAALGGRFNEFQNGFIYWHPKLGAHAVMGAIAGRWVGFGRENFGYPITDESTTPDGHGRYNHFKALQFPGAPESSIYWTPETGAHSIYGAIRERWARMGWERSPLGYPTSDDHPVPNYSRQDFQNGYIRWSPQGGAEAFSADGKKFCDFGTNNAMKPYGLIGAAWNSLGAENGALGCPTTPEMDVGGGGKGRIQSFEYGQAAWSPNAGKAVQVAYQAGNAIEFIWGPTEPFNYDFWIVRADNGSTNIGQYDIKTQRIDGWYVLRNALPGRTYSFIAEGCDEKGVLGEGAKAGCRQGWMNRVSVTMKPASSKQNPTLPDPPMRGQSCWTDLGCVMKTAQQAADTVEAVVKAVQAAAQLAG